MSAPSDLVDFFRLDASSDPISGTTHEKVRRSDRAQRKRQIVVVKKWKRTKRIGRGASGTVWVEHDEEGNTRVVKEVVKETSGASIKVDYHRELLALGQLSKHEDEFVHFHGWFEDDITVSLVMENLELGDLEKYIDPKVTEKDARSITKQLLEGLKILHEMGWAHRDLKPRNIFVVEAAPNWWVKIGDFGISKRLRGDQGTQTVIGSLDYMAPEILMPYVLSIHDSDSDDERAPPLTVAVDIWSLGCVLFQLLTRRMPFSSQRALKSYCRGKSTLGLEPIQAQQVSRNGIDLVSRMLKPFPETRITAAAALKHPWVNVNMLESGLPKKKSQGDLNGLPRPSQATNGKSLIAATRPTLLDEHLPSRISYNTATEGGSTAKVYYPHKAYDLHKPHGSPNTIVKSQMELKCLLPRPSQSSSRKNLVNATESILPDESSPLPVHHNSAIERGSTIKVSYPYKPYEPYESHSSSSAIVPSQKELNDLISVPSESLNGEILVATTKLRLPEKDSPPPMHHDRIIERDAATKAYYPYKVYEPYEPLNGGNKSSEMRREPTSFRPESSKATNRDGGSTAVALYRHKAYELYEPHKSSTYTAPSQKKLSNFRPQGSVSSPETSSETSSEISSNTLPKPQNIFQKWGAKIRWIGLKETERQKAPAVQDLTERRRLDTRRRPRKLELPTMLKGAERWTPRKLNWTTKKQKPEPEELSDSSTV